MYMCVLVNRQSVLVIAIAMYVRNYSNVILFPCISNVLLELSLDGVSYIASSVSMEIDDCKVSYIWTSNIILY